MIRLLSYLDKCMVKKNEGTNLRMATNCIQLLKFFHMWPEDGFTFINTIKCAVKLFCWLDLLILVMVMHLVHFLMNNPFAIESCANQMAGISSWLTADYVKVIFCMHYKEFRVLFKQIGDFTRIQKPDDIEQVENPLNLMLKIILYINYGSGYVGFLFKLVQECAPDDDSICGLVMNSYVPGINVLQFPFRQIMLAIQCLNGFCHAGISFTISWMLLSFAEYLGSFLRQLKKLLKEIPKITTRRERKQHIRKCVHYHHYIISSWEEYARVAGKVFLIHIANTSVIMSMIAFQLLVVEFQYVAVFHIFMWFLASLVCCMFGERLIEESITVADVAYESIPWDGDCDTAKDLMLIMIRSRKPLYIPGGKFGMLYHVHFMNMLRGSYSFLTLLFNTSK